MNVPAHACFSDEELVSRASKGDTGAYALLVDRHGARVVKTLYYRVGDRDEAEDLAQEVFVRAFRGIGGFKGEASFGTWIYRIVHNVAASYFVARAAKKRAGVRVPLDACEELQTPPAREADPPTALMSRELRDAIERSIGQLAPDAREYVILRDIEGKSYEEIAAIVDMPLGTVKSRIHRARLQIRRSLESYL